MKHLRKFNEDSSSEFYTVIPNATEYNKLVEKYSPEQSFSTYEKNKIIGIIDTWDKGNKEVSYEFKDTTFELMFGGRIFGHEYNIIKMSDDWFLIDTIPRDAYTFATRNHRSYESYRKFFKCNQFDGVLVFLNDKCNKNTSNRDNNLNTY